MKRAYISLFAAGSICGYLLAGLSVSETSLFAKQIDKNVASKSVRARHSRFKPIPSLENTTIPRKREEAQYSLPDAETQRLADLETQSAGWRERLSKRLDELTNMLALNPSQRAQAERLLQESFPLVHEPLVFAILTEKEREEVGLRAESVFAGSLNAQDEQHFSEALSGLLSSAQAEIFQRISAESKSNLAETVVYRELAALQSQMVLTQEQKDATFAALSEIAWNEQSGLEPATGILEQRRQRRIQAMQPILREEQLAAYKASIAGTVFRATVSADVDPGADQVTLFVNPEAF